MSAAENTLNTTKLNTKKDCLNQVFFYLKSFVYFFCRSEAFRISRNFYLANCDANALAGNIGRDALLLRGRRALRARLFFAPLLRSVASGSELPHFAFASLRDLLRLARKPAFPRRSAEPSLTLGLGLGEKPASYGTCLFASGFGDFGELKNLRCFPPARPLSPRKSRDFALSPSPVAEPTLRLSRLRLSASLLALLRGLAFGLGASASLHLLAGRRACAPSLRLSACLRFSLKASSLRYGVFSPVPEPPHFAFTTLRGLLRRTRKPALSLVFLACSGASSSSLRSDLRGLRSPRSEPSARRRIYPGCYDA